ncbi:MAG: hypothetical protein LBR26_03790 [Prevotella sp.]|nr:hypothetical protein [Prevotella sp.]
MPVDTIGNRFKIDNPLVNILPGKPAQDIAVRSGLKAFHIPARHNMPGEMNMPGNYVLFRTV